MQNTKKLAKKILLSSMVITGLQTAVAAEEIVFGFQDQFYSETMGASTGIDGPMVPAQYDVGKAIVSTNLSRWKTGAYGTLENRNDGYVVVSLKQPISHWNASVSANFRQAPCHSTDNAVPIKFYSGGGKEIAINVRNCDLQINDKTLEIVDQNSSYIAGNFTISLSAVENNQISLSYNGRELYRFPNKGFKTFKRFEMAFGHSNNASFEYGEEYLTDIVIGKNQ